MTEEYVDPNLGKLLEGMRNVDYTFPVAIADLIDNSVEAGATAVNVQVSFTPDEGVHVSISDNGSGMDASGLREGMRFGADNSTEDHRLGKFGLGMKTASIGFCRKLIVTSKCNGGNELLSAIWGLDRLAETNKWVLDLGKPDPYILDAFLEESEVLQSISGNKTEAGTLVTWEEVDRVLIKADGKEYRNPHDGLKFKVKQLEGHIRLVFHRFLNPADVRAQDVKIAVNGKLLEALDPFYRELKLCQPVQEKTWGFLEDNEAVEGNVSMSSFIFPHKDDVADPDHAAIIQKTFGVEKQGIYFYRENRLIDGPVWVGKYGRETHLNRLRIELDYESTVDHLFTVDIKKKNIIIQETLLDAIENELGPVRRQADLEARGRIKPPTGTTSAANLSIRDKRNSLVTADLEADGKKVTMTNNVTVGNEQLELIDLNGVPNTDIGVAISSGTTEDFINYSTSTKNGSLWEPSLLPGEKNIRVTIKQDHPWFRKTVQNNEPLSTAVEFLFYALAQAEMNNIHDDFAHVFEDFRVEVTRNLNRLVSDLPNPVEDD